MIKWIQSVLGRKLLGFIIAPMVIAVFTFINQFLPVGSQFTPDQMTAIIEKILEALMVFLAGQSAADVINGTPSRPKPEPAVPAVRPVVDETLPPEMK